MSTACLHYTEKLTMRIMHAKSLFHNWKYMHDMKVDGFKLGKRRHGDLLEIFVGDTIFPYAMYFYRPKRQSYRVTLKILAFKLIFVFEDVAVLQGSFPYRKGLYADRGLFEDIYKKYINFEILFTM